MLVLGIDPGTRAMGWGLVKRRGTRLEHVAHGVLRVTEKLSLSARLLSLEQGLCEVIQRYAPDCASVETLFFAKDAQAAAKLGHARGVVLLSLERRGVPHAEYAPARVKSTVTGRGRAEKRQVALMIKTLLSLDDEPPHDAADALALAVTHLRRAAIDARLAAHSPGNALKSRPRKRGRGVLRASAKRVVA